MYIFQISYIKCNHKFTVLIPPLAEFSLSLGKEEFYTSFTLYTEATTKLTNLCFGDKFLQVNLQ